MVLSPRPRRYEAHGRPWHATIWRFPSWLRAWFNTWHLVMLEASWFGVYHPLFDMTGFASPFVPFRLCFVATYQHLICYPANASAKGQEMVCNVRQVTTIGTGAFTHGWLHFSLQSDLVVWISWYSTPTKPSKTQQFTPGKMQCQEAQQRFRLRITLCCRLATLIFCQVVTSTTQVSDSGLQLESTIAVTRCFCFSKCKSKGWKQPCCSMKALNHSPVECLFKV